MEEKQILDRINRIKDVPTLPLIVFELNRLLQDPDTSVAKISQAIERDQAMALKILRLVNSAFYGFKTKISDIRSAVIMLGFNAVRNAIVSLSVIGALSKKAALKDFDVTDFWRHSLAVAVTSKNISAKSRLNSPDNCFVGGLLHDVGKVIMAQYFPELFAAVWNTVQSECCGFLEAERKALATDHAVIGAHLAAKWQLPQGLTDAIGSHHDYRPGANNSEFTLVIYLANVIVNSYDENPDCVIDLFALHPDARKLMIDSLIDVGDWYGGLAEEISSAYSFFLDAT
jgi:putative nucleotidyltransferase with HDIG domain